ncbi:MAG: ABC transporter ATP-binding protein/permease [Lentisphaeria bacterium]|nr:ABC transporter ATP-binding protein/permease [Lentisphaeria bacterium]
MSKNFIPWREFRQYMKYYRPHMKIMIVTTVATVVSSLLGVLLPLLVKKLLDFLGEDSVTTQDLTWEVCKLALLMALIVGVDFVNGFWSSALGTRLDTDMRRDFFLHLHHLPFNFFDKHKTGELMSRILGDLYQAAAGAKRIPTTILITLVTAIGSAIAMIYINKYLALITLIPMPFTVVWLIYFERKIRDKRRIVREKIAAINSQLEDSIQGIRETKSFTGEDREVVRFNEANNDYRMAEESTYKIYTLFSCGIQTIVHGYTLLTLLGGAVLIYFGKASVADIVAFMLYAGLITRPIFSLSQLMDDMTSWRVAFTRFLEIMSEKIEEEQSDAIELHDVKGDIELDHVYFRYPNSDTTKDEWVLNDITMHFKPGQTIALIGESGAGKSTVASLLTRFYEIDNGELKIDGHDINSINRRSLRKCIGIVRQTPFIFAASIKENLLLGNPDATDADLVEAAQRANILEFIESLPAKFDTRLSELGGNISGGQRQRLSIARLFLKNPEILIFDEATSALDNQSEALIKHAMAELCKGRTTIIIAHRLSTVRDADYIYCLKHGKVVEHGTHAELLAANGYYKELYTMHSF